MKHNNTFINVTNLKYFEKCNLSHFKNFDNKTFYQNSLNYALCMPLDYNAKLENFENKKNNEFINILPC